MCWIYSNDWKKKNLHSLHEFSTSKETISMEASSFRRPKRLKKKTKTYKRGCFKTFFYNIFKPNPDLLEKSTIHLVIKTNKKKTSPSPWSFVEHLGPPQKAGTVMRALPGGFFLNGAFKDRKLRHHKMWRKNFRGKKTTSSLLKGIFFLCSSKGVTKDLYSLCMWGWNFELKNNGTHIDTWSP